MTLRAASPMFRPFRPTLGRRALMTGSAAVVGTHFLPARQGMAVGHALEPLSPGIKLTAQLPTDPSAEDLMFVKQVGIQWVALPTGGTRATLETFIELKARVEAAGLKVWNIGNSNVHNMEEVTLGLPGRDQKIDEYKQFLRNLAKAGIKYTTYAHMGNGIWSSERETTRGGASARALNLASPQAAGNWGGKKFTGDLTHGRVFTKEEIWENYRYFIKAVVPVAEEVGIRIGIHPDDPPQPVLGGVPRCIFGNFEGYVKALEIANSPNIGVCLCCGTWLEGGKMMGKTVIEAIDYFGKRGKLWKIHYRNVTAPLPHFVETFIDNGYMDMYQIMKALKKVDFRGAVIADHVPDMVGGAKAGWAYSFGMMKAHLERANAEVR